MGWTVLYIAFGLVALWLLGEVLLQYKARLRWRLLAFVGFLTVVFGVLLTSVVVIALGAGAFAVGQTLVTLSFRRGFSTGWALGGQPGTSRRRRPIRPMAPLDEDAGEYRGPGPDGGYDEHGQYDEYDERGGHDDRGEYPEYGEHGERGAYADHGEQDEYPERGGRYADTANDGRYPEVHGTPGGYDTYPGRPEPAKAAGQQEADGIYGYPGHPGYPTTAGYGEYSGYPADPGADRYSAGPEQYPERQTRSQPGHDEYATASYAAYSDPYIGSTGPFGSAAPFGGTPPGGTPLDGYPDYGSQHGYPAGRPAGPDSYGSYAPPAGDPAAQWGAAPDPYYQETPPGGVWMPQQREAGPPSGYGYPQEQPPRPEAQGYYYDGQRY